MKKKEKRALLRDLLGLFQGANLQNAQVNMFVERGAKVVYQEVAGAGGASGDRGREGATGAAAAGAADRNGDRCAADRHFPLAGREDVGRQWYEFLLERGFIDGATPLADWLFLMGFSTACPPGVKPIAWLKTVETARLMLRRVYGPLIADRRLTVAAWRSWRRSASPRRACPCGWPSRSGSTRRTWTPSSIFCRPRPTLILTDFRLFPTVSDPVDGRLLLCPQPWC